ncbi:hypothetical protein AVEN_66574-1 [Araneus ventricosus]|uniref:Uncharacterized protein n=1 Tax=Araneus ventricosus TaxID=182803 RepID=A0A4Y2EG24_ARAVE|nr:hypothetical protein AVEN_66574-1 [Araneus ventricosus]
MVRLADRFTTLCQKYQTNSCTGRLIHTIRDWPWAFTQLPKEIRSPFNRLLRMWRNRKSATLCNEMPTNFIISPQSTKPTIHSPLVEERLIQQTLKTKYRSSNQIPSEEWRSN